MFSGNHPLLTQAFHPMVVRFFILQSHYRSPLDFSSTALEASEKALKRLWEAYEVLQKLQVVNNNGLAADKELDEKVIKLVNEFEEFMDDDLSTAKVLANMFELAPVINSIKDGLIKADAISFTSILKLQQAFQIYLEDILGLKSTAVNSNGALGGVMELLIDIRKEAKSKKDFATSDKIRNQLTALGINLKDEKGGEMSWSAQ
jgi:cysteinyl-tRNA synthetase